MQKYRIIMNNQNYTKKYLRQYFQSQRDVLSISEINQKSEQIFEHFFENLSKIIDIHQQNIGHIFLPIIHKKEVNTEILLHQIWKNYPNMITLTSSIDWENNALIHAQITPETIFETNKWGIKEPIITQKNQIFNPILIDWVLVPLLAFDKKGLRVGYGKGFYDKFLAECKPEILKIGVSFFDSVDEIIDIQPFDICLHQCITPDKIFIFS